MGVIEKLISTQEFATLPPVAARILGILENEDVDIREVASIIETDASLTLKLLRVANSPLYAIRTEITSIHQSIITLGLNRLTNIVLGISIFSKFLMSSQKSSIELIERFWWHSSCTGMVAKSVTKKIGKYFKEIEFIGGLLHDIGKLTMIQYSPEDYQEVLRKVQSDGISDIQAEEAVFGANHVQIGSEIAKLWKLPKDLELVMTYHSNPAEAPIQRGLVASVRLADLLCEVWGADFGEGIKELDIENLDAWKIICDEFIDLNDLDVENLTFELENDFRNSAEFLNILVQEA